MLAPILFGEEKFEQISSILRERFQHDIQLRLEIVSIIRALGVCPRRSKRLGRCRRQRRTSSIDQAVQEPRVVAACRTWLIVKQTLEARAP
jgi:hypothetical protein